MLLESWNGLNKKSAELKLQATVVWLKSYFRAERLNLYLVTAGYDSSGDLFLDGGKIGVGLELHVTLVARLVIQDFHLT